MNLMDDSYQMIYKNAPAWGEEGIKELMNSIRFKYGSNKSDIKYDQVDRKVSKAREEEYGES